LQAQVFTACIENSNEINMKSRNQGLSSHVSSRRFSNAAGRIPSTQRPLQSALAQNTQYSKSSQKQQRGGVKGKIPLLSSSSISRVVGRGRGNARPSRYLSSGPSNFRQQRHPPRNTGNSLGSATSSLADIVTTSHYLGSKSTSVDLEVENFQKDDVAKYLISDDKFLPDPHPPSQCKLFCCFYAEFDNIVGPQVSFQAPKGFMEKDIFLTVDRIHDELSAAFKYLGKKSTEEDDVGDNFIPCETNKEESTRGLFDSTKEYIITGNELADRIICLSTHNFHIMSRPTIISNSRYERNSHFFSVGFVLRREMDPRPFKPILAKISSTFRRMEIESQFLTSPGTKPKLQIILEKILICLNSREAEANILLNEANYLNLKLFHLQKPVSEPVPDYLVPVLLKPESKLQHFEWDLTINWLVPHIDGVKDTFLISRSSEVDIEMVRACLGVLKHLGVITFVDMFRFSNTYESTHLATEMLGGRAPKLLSAALQFCIKDYTEEKYNHNSHSDNNNHMLDDKKNESVSTSKNRPVIRLRSEAQNINLTSVTSKRQTSVDSDSQVSFVASSFPPQINIREEETLTSKSFDERQSYSSPLNSTAPNFNVTKCEEHYIIKLALAKLYCAFNRNTTVGEVLLSKVAATCAFDSLANHDNGSSDTQKQIIHNVGPSGDDKNAKCFPTQPESSHHREHESQYYDGHAGFKREPIKPKTQSKKDLNWGEVLDLFDHRRFVIFGIINGLIRRIHNFPLAYNSVFEEHVQYSLDGSVHPEYNLALRVAASMDGTKCDDELSCMYQQPIFNLINLVKTKVGQEVMSVFTTSSTSK